MKRTLLSGLLVTAGLSVGVAAPSRGTDQPAPISDGQEKRPPQTPIRVGGKVAEANVIKKVPPEYPASAKAAGVQGTVELDVVISKDGEPESLNVVSSPSDDLSRSALDAVRQWRYRPTLLNGEPVEIVTNVRINYTLAK